MKVKIKYIAIDPYYSDQTQTFIGDSHESIDNQIVEFERYIGREHPAGISAVYERKYVYDDCKFISYKL